MRRIDNYIYEKSVKISITNSIISKVYRIDTETKEQLECIGIKFFNTGIFQNLIKEFDKANEWADERIKDCIENENGPEFYA